jgi:RNA methyltransferase, TrmH family
MLSKTQVKYIQSLLLKKFRDEYGEYIVEGPKMVSEALSQSRDDIQNIYAHESWVTEQDVSAIKITEISEDEMKKISSLSTPPPVLAVLRKPVWNRPETFEGLTLLLDTIQDPGNLGTIIRTADWFGVKHIVCNKGSADCYNPKVIQSTMGSIFRMQIFYEDIVTVIETHPSKPVLAASLEGKALTREEKWGDAFLVIGNESGGIGPEILAKANRKILIPRKGNAESLNAAVATGILLYELTT